jgi:hypothetical protein
MHSVHFDATPWTFDLDQKKVLMSCAEMAFTFPGYPDLTLNTTQMKRVMLLTDFPHLGFIAHSSFGSPVKTGKLQLGSPVVMMNLKRSTKGVAVGRYIEPNSYSTTYTSEGGESGSAVFSDVPDPALVGIHEGTVNGLNLFTTLPVSIEPLREAALRAKPGLTHALDMCEDVLSNRAPISVKGEEELIRAACERFAVPLEGKRSMEIISAMSDFVQGYMDSKHYHADVLAWQLFEQDPDRFFDEVYNPAVEAIKPSSTTGAFLNDEFGCIPEFNEAFFGTIGSATRRESFVTFIRFLKRVEHREVHGEPHSDIIKVQLKSDNYNRKKLMVKKLRTIQVPNIFLSLVQRCFSAGYTEYIYSHPMVSLIADPTTFHTWAKVICPAYHRKVEAGQPFVSYAMDYELFDSSIVPQDWEIFFSRLPIPSWLKAWIVWYLGSAPFKIKNEDNVVVDLGRVPRGNPTGNYHTGAINVFLNVNLINAFKRVNPGFISDEGAKVVGDDTQFVLDVEFVDGRSFEEEYMLFCKYHGIGCKVEERCAAEKSSYWRLASLIQYSTYSWGGVAVNYCSDVLRRVATLTSTSATSEQADGVLRSLSTSLYCAKKVPGLSRLLDNCGVLLRNEAAIKTKFNLKLDYENLCVGEVNRQSLTGSAGQPPLPVEENRILDTQQLTWTMYVSEDACMQYSVVNTVPPGFPIGEEHGLWVVQAVPSWGDVRYNLTLVLGLEGIRSKLRYADNIVCTHYSHDPVEHYNPWPTSLTHGATHVNDYDPPVVVRQSVNVEKLRSSGESFSNIPFVQSFTTTDDGTQGQANGNRGSEGGAARGATEPGFKKQTEEEAERERRTSLIHRFCNHDRCRVLGAGWKGGYHGPNSWQPVCPKWKALDQASGVRPGDCLPGIHGQSSTHMGTCATDERDCRSVNFRVVYQSWKRQCIPVGVEDGGQLPTVPVQATSVHLGDGVVHDRDWINPDGVRHRHDGPSADLKASDHAVPAVCARSSVGECGAGLSAGGCNDCSWWSSFHLDCSSSDTDRRPEDVLRGSSVHRVFNDVGTDGGGTVCGVRTRVVAANQLLVDQQFSVWQDGPECSYLSFHLWCKPESELDFGLVSDCAAEWLQPTGLGPVRESEREHVHLPTGRLPSGSPLCGLRFWWRDRSNGNGSMLKCTRRRGHSARCGNSVVCGDGDVGGSDNDLESVWSDHVDRIVCEDKPVPARRSSVEPGSAVPERHCMSYEW